MSNILRASVWPGLVVAAAVVLNQGCASMGPPVRVYGEPQNVERLAGNWWGEYIGNWDHRRQGSISFKLVGADQQAHGEVHRDGNRSRRQERRARDVEIGGDDEKKTGARDEIEHHHVEQVQDLVGQHYRAMRDLS